jgi:hypothetical protein
MPYTTLRERYHAMQSPRRGPPMDAFDANPRPMWFGEETTLDTATISPRSKNNSTQQPPHPGCLCIREQFTAEGGTTVERPRCHHVTVPFFTRTQQAFLVRIR